MIKFIKNLEVNCHLKGNKSKLFLILVLWSILYCGGFYLVTSYTMEISNQEMIFFIFYIMMIIYTLIDNQMIFLFRSIQKDKRKVSLKKTWKPQILLSTIIYISVLALSYVIQYLMSISSDQIIGYYVFLILSVISMVGLLLYIPFRILCVFIIYDGEAKILNILKRAIQVITKQYRNIFYSFLIIGIVSMIYQSILSTFFGIDSVLFPISNLYSLIVNPNAFHHLFTYLPYIGENNAYLMISFISIIYALLQTFIFLYYYMFLGCVVDDDFI